MVTLYLLLADNPSMVQVYAGLAAVLVDAYANVADMPTAVSPV